MFKKMEKYTTSQHGLFIGFIGLPGVGKSSLTKALAKKLGAQFFVEPEASKEAWGFEPNEWESHVDQLEAWVCKSNLKNFTDARSIADRGGKAVADAGIFLVNRELIHLKCFAWYYGLLSKEGYEQILKQSLSDWNEAPQPDVLILVETDKDTWKKYVGARGRTIDGNAECLDGYDDQQQGIAGAAQKFADEREIPIIRFSNTAKSIEESAELLHNELIEVWSVISRNVVPTI